MAAERKSQSSRKKSHERAHVSSRIGLFFKGFILVILIVLLAAFAFFYIQLRHL